MSHIVPTSSCRIASEKTQKVSASRIKSLPCLRTSSLVSSEASAPNAIVYSSTILFTTSSKASHPGFHPFSCSIVSNLRMILIKNFVGGSYCSQNRNRPYRVMSSKRAMSECSMSSQAWLYSGFFLSSL